MKLAPPPPSQNETHIADELGMTSEAALLDIEKEKQTN